MDSASPNAQHVKSDLYVRRCSPSLMRDKPKLIDASTRTASAPFGAEANIDVEIALDAFAAVMNTASCPCDIPEMYFKCL